MNLTLHVISWSNLLDHYKDTPFSPLAVQGLGSVIKH